MSELEAARSNVRARRHELLKSLEAARARLTVRHLAEKAMGALDPRVTGLGRVAARLKQHPLLAAALLAGAGWLASKSRPRPPRPAPKTRMKTSRKIQQGETS